MRQGLTIVPAGLVLVAALLGAGGPGASTGDEPSVLDDRFGQPIAPIYLLLRPDVQRDLQLNRRQVLGARALIAQLIERGLAVKHKTGQAAMKEKWDIDEAMAGWLRQELSPVQLDRLTQISLQWEGVSAMQRPTIAEYLGLGEPQRTKIRTLLADRNRRLAAGALGAAEFDRITREAAGELNALQRQQWQELLGPPCRFSIDHPAGLSTHPAAVTGLPGPPAR